ncbi:alpha/beta-hydrolase [Hypoxylon sp. FL1284]|nr:alpha/beta-hydrolase [Hypoxylon sp. FL1284]
MAGVKTVEGTFEVGGVSLFTKTWHPDPGPTRAKLILIHGFSDHVDRYYELFPSLARRGVAVYGFDQRGWGRSVRTRPEHGRSGPTGTVLADIAAFARERAFPAEPADAPVFVLGHSMGGAEAVALASTPAYDDVAARVRGWLLEAPLLGFAPAIRPWRLTVVVGRLVGRLAPGFQLVQKVPPKHLSRDAEVRRSVTDDPLLHDTGTLEGLAGMIERAELIMDGTLALNPKVRSLFLAHGTADAVTDFDSSKEWFDRQKLDDGRFKAYDGFLHQIHADVGKEEFYQDVGDWILERCDGDGAGSVPGSKL